MKSKHAFQKIFSYKSIHNGKVPGDVAPMGKLNNEVKAFRDSIQKKTLPELEDLLTRQESIVAKKYLMKKLPDEGQKVIKKIEELKN